MANEEHLAILKSGVENWNKWREESRGINPDISIINLRSVNIIGANLIGANLIETDLRGSLHLPELLYSHET